MNAMGSAIGNWISAFAGDMWSLYQQDQNFNFQEDQARKNREMSYDFAKHGIQWRVEDAVAAGLHPLFALGGQIAQPSPPTVVGAESSVGRGAMMAGDTFMQLARMQADEEFRSAQLSVMERRADAESEKDFAMASYYRSLGARASQQDRGNNPVITEPLPGMSESGGDAAAVRRGQFEVERARVFPRSQESNAAAAGTHPIYIKYDYGRRADGSTIINYIPQGKALDESPYETLESIRWWQWPAVIKYNAQMKGVTWLQALDDFSGIVPQWTLDTVRRFYQSDGKRGVEGVIND